MVSSTPSPLKSQLTEIGAGSPKEGPKLSMMRPAWPPMVPFTSTSATCLGYEGDAPAGLPFKVKATSTCVSFRMPTKPNWCRVSPTIRPFPATPPPRPIEARPDEASNRVPNGEVAFGEAAISSTLAGNVALLVRPCSNATAEPPTERSTSSTPSPLKSPAKVGVPGRPAGSKEMVERCTVVVRARAESLREPPFEAGTGTCPVPKFEPPGTMISAPAPPGPCLPALVMPKSTTPSPVTSPTIPTPTPTRSPGSVPATCKPGIRLPTSARSTCCMGTGEGLGVEEGAGVGMGEGVTTGDSGGAIAAAQVRGQPAPGVWGSAGYRLVFIRVKSDVPSDSASKFK